MSDFYSSDAIVLPWDDYAPDGENEAAWLEQRGRIAAGLLAFEGRPPLDLAVVGPRVG